MKELSKLQMEFSLARLNFIIFFAFVFIYMCIKGNNFSNTLRIFSLKEIHYLIVLTKKMGGHDKNAQ